jgi:hypothetical protein
MSAVACCSCRDAALSGQTRAYRVARGRLRLALDSPSCLIQGKGLGVNAAAQRRDMKISAAHLIVLRDEPCYDITAHRPQI